MLITLKFIYINFILPPGIIVIGLIIAALRLRKYRSRYVKPVASLAVCLYLISTGFFSNPLIRPLESAYIPPSEVSGDAIVVLGAGAFNIPMDNGIGTLPGAASSRLLTGVQLYHLLKVPIILSSGQVYDNDAHEVLIQRQILVNLGVPEDKIILDNQSFNTTLSGKNVKAIADEYGFEKMILVTSAFHMPRSVKQFQKFGVNVVPYPTDYRSHQKGNVEFNDFWMQAYHVENVSLAVKEYIGLAALKWY